MNNYREQHPDLYRLAGVHDAYIEAEHSTGESQPSQTIVNLAAAHNAERRCLFACRADVAEDVHNTLTVGAPCCHSDHDRDGERRFYTTTAPLSIDGETMTRPGQSGEANVWVVDEQTGQYVLRGADGGEYARFNTAAEIYEDASQYPTGGECRIYPPVIPEYEFDGGDPTAAEWDIIVVPEPETNENGDRALLTQADRDNVPLCDLPETAAESDAAPPSVETDSSAGDGDNSEQQDQRSTAETYDRTAAVDDFAAHYNS